MTDEVTRMDIVEELRGIRRNGSWSNLRPRGNEAHPVCCRAADEIERLRAAEAPLRAEIARLREALKDPNAVHVNLLRGDIARPTVHQMIHIYSPAKVRDGLETYARAALAQETGDE